MSINHSKKIVIDARMYNSSGIGVYIQNILLGIKDHEVKIIVSANFGKTLTGFNIIPSNIKSYSVKELFLLPFKIPKCDVFWSPHYTVPIFWIRAKKRVVTVHDVYHVTAISELSFLKKLYARFLIQWALWVSDKVITVSDFSKSEILKYFRCTATKIEVIKNGVKAVGVIKEWVYLQDAYKLPSRYLLFVGNVKPHKNIRGLLEAYLRLDDWHRKHYKVVIVGVKQGFITGDLRLFDWIDSHPKLKSDVVFTGYVHDDDMDSIYHYASLFVFPSLYEGFGLPPLEAMLNKCPVIASDAASIKEVCKDGALYFNPNSFHEISVLIAQLLDSDVQRKSLIESGIRVAKSYSWASSIGAHVRLFNEKL